MKLFRRTYRRGIALEWEPQDLWVGIFWKKSIGVTDLWICLLPCVPIHIWWHPRRLI